MSGTIKIEIRGRELLGNGDWRMSEHCRRRTYSSCIEVQKKRLLKTVVLFAVAV